MRARGGSASGGEKRGTGEKQNQGLGGAKGAGGRERLKQDGKGRRQLEDKGEGDG